MKLNKWTMSLAALGVVSLASAAKAQEATQGNFVQTALSSTTISGYVDTSIEWTMHPSRQLALPLYYGGGLRDGKEDGFNLNVVKLTLEKPLDESEWSSGYKVDLLLGPDAVGYNPSPGSTGELGIKQAYVALRTPVGNGIDWKAGVFDTIIGYEVFDAGSNPNFSRSYGWSFEPTQHTGILGTYQVNDMISVAAGVANTLTAGINARNTDPDGSGNAWEGDRYWCKTWMTSVAITAPEDMGFMAGSTLYGGIVYGFDGGNAGGPNEDRANYYAGLTMATPIAGLSTGVSFDHATHASDLDTFIGGGSDNELTAVGLYASYQATEKLSVHGRAEWAHIDPAGPTNGGIDIYAFTGTVQYDLWANVLTRLELRYDHIDPIVATSLNNTLGWNTDNEIWSAYLNVIYMF